MMPEAWQNDCGRGGGEEDDDHDDKRVEEVSKMKLQLLQLNSMENKNWKKLESILRIIICVLSGDTCMGLACVTETLLSKRRRSSYISSTKMATTMDEDRAKIDNIGHPHGPLKWGPWGSAEKPYYCGGCKEIMIVSKECYHCDPVNEDDHQKCEFKLHDECVPRLPDSAFRLGLIGCDLFFQQQQHDGKNMVCDACGKEVKGWFYRGSSSSSSKGKSYNYYLHPCCAMLAFKRKEVNQGNNIIFDLKEKTTLVCLKCENKIKGARSWVYVSRCRKYCFHVSCMKEYAEIWTEAEGNNLQLQTISTTTAGSSSTRGGVLRRRHTREFLEMVIELFIGVTCTIFGIPTWLVTPFFTWIRKLW